MRKSDKGETDHSQSRTIRSIAGLVVTIGGVILAIVRPDHVYIGMACAMVGAGLVDAAHILSIFTRR